MISNDFYRPVVTFAFFFKEHGQVAYKMKVIRVTHWNWENCIRRSSEVIRGKKAKKITNHKIFCSTLFLLGALGTLNFVRRLIHWTTLGSHFSFFSVLHFIYWTTLSYKQNLKLTSKWHQNNPKITSKVWKFSSGCAWHF